MRDDSRPVEGPPHDSRRPLRVRLGPGGGRAWLVAAIAAGVVLLDAATKLAATELLAEEGRIELLGGLVDLELYRNFAGPNNILPGHVELLSAFSILASLALAAAAFRVRSAFAAVAVGLLLGGAVGNLLDRLLREPSPLRGGVIDWFSLGGLTKMMNVADLAINLALLVVLAAALFGASPAGESPGPGRRRDRRPE